MNSSDWFQFGAGIALGTLLSRTIGQALTGAQAPTAPLTSALTTREQIQALLDNLDVRLARGEITEATYRQVSAKWTARLERAVAGPEPDNR